MKLAGYCDRWSVRPGEMLTVHVHSPESPYTMETGRLSDGANSPQGTVAFHPVDLRADPRGEPSSQNTTSGSFAWSSATALDATRDWTLQAWVRPTAPGSTLQGIVTQPADAESPGVGLVLTPDGRFAVATFEVGRLLEQVTSAEVAIAGEWYFVACVWSELTRAARLYVAPASPAPTWLTPVTGPVSLPQRRSDPPVLLGACTILGGTTPRPAAGGILEGSLERPAIWRCALSEPDVTALARGAAPDDIRNEDLIACWDFSQVDGTRVKDVKTRHAAARLVNTPALRVPGHSWQRSELDWRRAPSQFAAAHFHADDLEDASWTPTSRVAVPKGLPSGVYALRLAAAGSHTYIPFFVTADAATPRPRVCMLMPTLTYLAYANRRLDAEAFELGAHERTILDHPELGSSLYDLHADGSPTYHSSRLRPVLELTPDYVSAETGCPRHFAADLNIVGWLERRGQPHDVVTDEDLDERGESLIDRYDVLITGSHPEYSTERMLDALRQFLSRGKRVIYLGGNGFYWVTSRDRARPHLIEVRRGHAGSRPFDSDPGELHHALTGEPGGLWRHRGRPPQRLVGVGFTAQGSAGAAPYRRRPESFSDRFSFVFEGVDEESSVGDYGPMGAAAGDEVDRADRLLGTPREAVVLASSSRLHDDRCQGTVEDVCEMAPGQGGAENRNVRADMVIGPSADGGTVFSVGSMAWALCLAAEFDDRDVSRITGNVLDAFLEGRVPVDDGSAGVATSPAPGRPASQRASSRPGR